MSKGKEEIEAALGHFIESFATDGYRLDVTGFEEGVLDLRIEAEPGACAECLVPPQIMTGLVRTELRARNDIADIRIRYPDLHD